MGILRFACFFFAMVFHLLVFILVLAAKKLD